MQGSYSGNIIDLLTVENFAALPGFLASFPLEGIVFFAIVGVVMVWILIKQTLNLPYTILGGIGLSAGVFILYTIISNFGLGEQFPMERVYLLLALVICVIIGVYKVFFK